MKQLHRNSLLKQFGFSVLTLSFTFGAMMSLNAAWPEKKIGGEFAARVQAKEEVAKKKDVTDKKAWLAKKDIATNSVTSEEALLYVADKMSDDEVAAMEKRGIKINPDVYIPAVGRHPYGFHLAEVPLTAVDYLESVENVVFVETAELQSKPQNDLGRTMIKTDLVQAGTGVNSSYTGAGVKIAIADSGFDVTHADFPTSPQLVETYDMTDGTSTLDWGTSVANTVSNHGTHVAGSAIGSGSLSGGQYKGGAPGASVYLYKIGSDATSSASEVDEIEALSRAVAVGCDIFSMSYGGYSTWMDGSSGMAQAIDAAVTVNNMLVFISAGNEAAANRHYSTTVAPGASSSTISFTIDNSWNGAAMTSAHNIRIIWRDGSTGDYNMTLACSNLVAGESLSLAYAGTSPSSTEGVRYSLTPNIAAGGSKTYNLTVSNTPGGDSALAHLYSVSSPYATFAGADSSYTISNPATADEAIAVGAWVHRASWTNYQGYTYNYNPVAVYDSLATFSSRGPRVDGTTKPEIVAPGQAMISCSDSVVPAIAPYIIDNDGIGLGVTNVGPADYFVTQGTSMACPLAAGSAALLVEAVTTGSPTAADLRSILLNTADNTVTKAVDNESGNGLINIQAAVQDVESTYPVELDYFMVD